MTPAQMKKKYRDLIWRLQQLKKQHCGPSATFSPRLTRMVDKVQRELAQRENEYKKLTGQELQMEDTE